MNKLVFTLVSGLLVSQSLLAQVTIKEGGFIATNVSNEGVVVGEFGQNTPFYLWDTSKNTFEKIGGISSGNDVGGYCSISADGRYVVGASERQKEVDTKVKRIEIKEKYMFTQLYSNGSTIFAVGRDKDGNNGILVQSLNHGETWQRVTAIPAEVEKNGLESICFLTDYTGIIGGWNGLFLYTTNADTWNVVDEKSRPGKEDDIKVYRSLCAHMTDQENGIVIAIAELKNGTSKVYYSTDGAESWQSVTTKWTGNPIRVSNYGNRFYIVTSSGSIYSSESGSEWKSSYTANTYLNELSFYDNQIGMAVGNNKVLLTIDGGESWNPCPVPNKNYTSIVWQSKQNAYITAQTGEIYQTIDGGKRWEQMNSQVHKSDDQIADMERLDMGWVTCGANSTFYTKTFRTSEKVYEMARYDTQLKKWETMGGYGTQSGQNISSAYAVSGDGKTLGGLAYKMNNAGSFEQKRIGTATVWDDSSKKLTDLGCRIGKINKNSRINGLNEDGTIAVGWKENDRGSWEAAIWHKTSKGWDDGKYMLDNLQEADNSANHLIWGKCVSPNGKWFGGSGVAYMNGPLSVTPDKAPQPYIYNEQNGVTYLGMLDKAPASSGFYGWVQSVNNDGTIAIGTYASAYTVPETFYPFIWIKGKGPQDLNDYVKEHFNQTLQDVVLTFATDMSDNGRYIVARGIKNNETVSALIDLNGTSTGNETIENTLNEAKVYTNINGICVELPNGVNTANYTLYTITGQQIKAGKLTSQSEMITTEAIQEGIYILNLCLDQKAKKTYKLRIKH